MITIEKLTTKEREILSSVDDELELITGALTEKDILMELWSREEQSFFAPAGKWENDYTIAETFKFRTFMFLFIAIMTVIPMFVYIPYLVKKYLDRKCLKEQIIAERMKVKTSLLIPITKQSDFDTLQKSYWGKRLIQEGIIYKLNI